MRAARVVLRMLAWLVVSFVLSWLLVSAISDPWTPMETRWGFSVSFGVLIASCTTVVLGIPFAIMWELTLRRRRTPEGPLCDDCGTPIPPDQVFNVWQNPSWGWQTFHREHIPNPRWQGDK